METKRTFEIVKAEYAHVERLRSQLTWESSDDVIDELREKSNKLFAEMIEVMAK